MKKLEYQKLNNFYNMEAVYQSESSEDKEEKKSLV